MIKIISVEHNETCSLLLPGNSSPTVFTVEQVNDMIQILTKAAYTMGFKSECNKEEYEKAKSSNIFSGFLAEEGEK